MLKDQVGIELEAGRIEQAADRARAQGREQAGHLRAVDRPDRVRDAGDGGLERLEPGQIRLVGEIKGRKGLGEGRGEEGAAVGGERADRGGTDAVMAERDAAARAVIAERLLGFEHDHPAMMREPGPGRKTRDAAADDQEIRARHGARR